MFSAKLIHFSSNIIALNKRSLTLRLMPVLTGIGILFLLVHPCLLFANIMITAPPENNIHREAWVPHPNFHLDESSIVEGPIYVNDDAMGNNDGTSWADAYTDLQDALSDARSSVDPIWVAAGIYLPSIYINGAPAGRNNVFYLTSGKQLYGGFAGDETSLEERNPHLNPTILSGDLDQNDAAGLTQAALLTDPSRLDNVNQVVIIDNSGSDLILDGFEISGGNSNEFTEFGLGGGGLVHRTFSNSSPTIRNCSFSENATTGNGGAVMDISEGTSSLMFADCIFANNWAHVSGGAVTSVTQSSSADCMPVFEACVFAVNGAEARGGAIFNDASNGGISSAVITGCQFFGNTAGTQGGAVNNYGNVGESYGKLVNSIFIANTAGSRGGAVYNVNNTDAGNTEIINCSFYNNTTAGFGGAIYNVSGSANAQDLLVANSILWNNDTQEKLPVYNSGTGKTTLTYSIYDDGTIDNAEAILPIQTTGSNNLDSDPLFVDPLNNDVRLLAASPAINAGDNTAVPVGISMDYLENERIANGTVDMGAYEQELAGDGVCTSIVDFEAPTTSTNFQYFANDNLNEQLAAVVSNPLSDAINGSSTVLSFTKTAAGQTFAGAYSNPNPFRPLDFTLADQLCVKVLMDHPGNIALKLEASTTGGGNWIQTVENTNINEWVELCFDVSANSEEAPFESAWGNSYSRLTVFPDFGIPGTGTDVITFFDEIRVCYGDGILCGDENLQLGSGNLTSGTYRGEITLTSANTIEAGPVTFTAGQSITLEAGFHAGPGVAFHAKIEDCIPAPNPNILEEIEVPNERRLLPGQLEMAVYPNPSSFETNIAFHLSASGRTSLEVYHSTGTLLQRLLDQEVMEVGEYTRQLQTTTWESGMYLVVLRSAGSTVVKKIMVIR